MDYVTVKEWLDNLVRIQREASQKYSLTNGIEASLNANTVLVHDGIDVIADVMNIQLTECKLKNPVYCNYEYSFEYEGVTFISFTKERLERFVSV